MQVYEMLSEQQARLVGGHIVELLVLTKNKDGKYNTTWGHKTLEGLGRCVQRMIEEAKPTNEIKE